MLYSWFLIFLYKLGFDKGVYQLNDRLLHELVFFRKFKVCVSENFPEDFVYYLIDLIRNNNRMVSYMILKKKITSNLKNFHELKINQNIDKTKLTK